MFFSSIGQAAVSNKISNLLCMFRTLEFLLVLGPSIRLETDTYKQTNAHAQSLESDEKTIDLILLLFSVAV